MSSPDPEQVDDTPALDDMIARLKSAGSAALLATATDGNVYALRPHLEELHEAVSDLVIFTDDPQTNPLFTGWSG